MKRLLFVCTFASIACFVMFGVTVDRSSPSDDSCVAWLLASYALALPVLVLAPKHWNLRRRAPPTAQADVTYVNRPPLPVSGPETERRVLETRTEFQRRTAGGLTRVDAYAAVIDYVRALCAIPGVGVTKFEFDHEKARLYLQVSYHEKSMDLETDDAT